MEPAMKKIISALIFITLSFSGFALSSEDFSLSVEPLFGMKWGQIDEYVFLKECTYDDDKLSELNWEIKPEFYGGAKVSGSWKKFFGELQFSAGFPMQTGLMMDSDWLNADTAGLEDYQYKTNYSESDNYLDYDYTFEIKAGYDFEPYKNDFLRVSVKPFAGLYFNSISFDAEGGSYWYGETVNGTYQLPWNDSSTKEEHFTGKVISYKRTSYIFWLGFDSDIELSKNFILNAGFKFSPYLYAESIDTHWLKQKMFADKTPGYFGAFKWNLGAEYKIAKRHSVLLNASYFYMRVLRGDSFAKSTTSKTYAKDTTDDGGAGAKHFDISLSYRFKFF